MSQKRGLLKSSIFMLVIVLVAIIAFFLPYVSSTEEYREYLESKEDQQTAQSYGMTYRDYEDVSLFEYAKVYFRYGSEIFNNDSMSIFYGAMISSFIVLTLLVFFAAIKKKPILTFVLGTLLGILSYSTEWDFVDRGIVPSHKSIWGISHYLFYICAAMIVTGAVWMFVEKRKIKKASRTAEM